MTKKAYFSNLSAGWPLSRQRELLGDVERAYEDKLGPGAIKARQAAALKERAAMLRPTRRATDETILVAAPTVLAFDRKDFGVAVAAASARNATLVFVAAGLTLPPAPTTAVLAELFGLFDKQHQTRGLHKTRKDRGAERAADAKRRAGLIAADWPKPEPSTAELLARAGKDGRPMAPGTARAYLGPRPAAQKAYQNELNREAGRAAARARKKGASDGDG